MQVSHAIGHMSVSRDDVEDPSFLISNKNMGYACFAEEKKSRYHGVFLRSGGDIYKTISNIGIMGKAEKLINRFHHIEREYAGNKECFFLPYGLNSFAYGLEKAQWYEVSLDFRGIYDTEGETKYTIGEEKNCVVVKCERGSKKHYLAFHTGERPRYEKIEEPAFEHYELDRDRNSPPYELKTCRAFRIRAKELVASLSEDRLKAITEASWVYKNLGTLHGKQKEQLKETLGVKRAGDMEQRMAFLCAKNSLDSLSTENGMMAGLPWFFQDWTRDELVALKYLQSDARKKITKNLLESLKEDGRLPNILPGGDANADSVGWLFKRIAEDLESYTIRERKKIKEKLIESIIRLKESHIKDYLVYNEAKETWMDSTYMDDGRCGARIEIQALFLSMLDLAFQLTGNEKFSRLSRITKKRVREAFLLESGLKDGEYDPTIRPNIFLAAYIYPDLLEKEEWINCVKNALENIWLDWGALSSIDKGDPLYVEYSTGEDPRSYHRGDAWYYMNNMAALVMHSLDPKGFKTEIDAIIKASTQDILWMGAVGHHSEISPAKEQRAAGCYAQAWSNALYLELFDAIYP